MSTVKFLKPTSRKLVLPRLERRRARLDPKRFESESWRHARKNTRLPSLPPGLKQRFGPQHARLTKNLKALNFMEPTQRLLHRLSFGWTLAEQERLDGLGLEAWLEEQLHPETIDDGGLEEALRDALPSLSMSAVEILINYEELEQPVYELWLATLYRAIYSPRQLHERLVHFWSDHFSINIFDDLQFALFPIDHQMVVRDHALGPFGDLLRASAHSPAMLIYLTNASNIAGHPNENYARELMELHTLGVDGGYSQSDVREVARCLTGWTISNAEDLSWGTFRFDAATHDQEAKVVLGQTIAADGGQNDGEQVLDILAQHPSTARFISQKLLSRLFGIDAGPKTVERMAEVFTATGGDIREMIRTGARDIWPTRRGRGKLKRPFHLATSTLRSTFAGLEDPYFLLSFLFEAGHLPFSWGPPNGYPDGGPYWAGLPLPRWNFGQYLVGGLAAVDFSFLDPGESPEVIADILGLVLQGGPLETARRRELVDFIASRPQGVDRIYEGLALAISAPENQYH